MKVTLNEKLHWVTEASGIAASPRSDARTLARLGKWAPEPDLHHVNDN